MGVEDEIGGESNSQYIPGCFFRGRRQLFSVTWGWLLDCFRVWGDKRVMLDFGTDFDHAPTLDVWVLRASAIWETLVSIGSVKSSAYELASWLDSSHNALSVIFKRSYSLLLISFILFTFTIHTAVLSSVSSLASMPFLRLWHRPPPRYKETKKLNRAGDMQEGPYSSLSLRGESEVVSTVGCALF